MRDPHDTSTHDAFPRGRRRPAKYSSTAEKQKAYRDRLRERTWSYDDLTDILTVLLSASEKIASQVAPDNVHGQAHAAGLSDGITMAWEHIVGELATDADKAVIAAIMGRGSR